MIERAPERLREVPGIGPMRAERIVRAWADQKVIREIMVFLHGHGVGTSRAVRIFKTYGVDAVQVMSENPYRLARDIRGIGFKTADAIAMRLGVEPTAMIRVRAGISHALSEAMEEGHCGLPEEELRSLAAELLGVKPELVETALALELADGTVVADMVGDRRCVFLAGLHAAERGIAARLRTLSAGDPPWSAIDPARAIPWAEARIGLTLADSQREAVATALRSRLLVITGGPGVGKTTSCARSSPSSSPRGAGCCSPPPRDEPPNASPRPRGWRREPSIVCLRQTRGPAVSGGARRIRSKGTCWCSMRPRWWTCR